jgi:hypothetical protein
MKEKGNVDDMADDTRNPKLEERRPGPLAALQR